MKISSVKIKFLICIHETPSETATEKKTWQTATIEKDDCTFSVVYSSLKIKSKAHIFENVFKIPWNM